MEIRQFDILPRLAEMQSNLGVIRRYSRAGKKNVELKIQKWVTPMGLLPLTIYAEQQNMRITTGRNTESVKSYLRLIRFPEGTRNMDWFKGKSYLPLSKLSIARDDDVLTKYEKLILDGIKNMEIRDSFRNSLKYLTSELVTNTKEHAFVDEYWIQAQYWPTTQTCEIAIADTGVGYLESYKGTQYEVSTHEDAIRNAVEGNSSKNDTERGAGIPSIIKIFCEGYGGSIVIMSGDSLLYVCGDGQSFYKLDIPWQGAFIGIHFKLGIINALAYLSSD
jgi:hypothetical protein